MRGGTGSRSEYEEQPNFMPDKFESGTPNTSGYAGLTAGIDFILSQGLNTINAYEKSLTKLFCRVSELLTKSQFTAVRTRPGE